MTGGRFVPVLLGAMLAGCSSPPSRTTEVAHPVWETPTVLHSPEIGVRYDLTAFTHCGLQALLIDEELWLPVADQPELTGPVFGFNYSQGSLIKTDNNYDHGDLILTDRDHATYTSSAGWEVELERWQGPPPTGGGCF